MVQATISQAKGQIILLQDLTVLYIVFSIFTAILGLAVIFVLFG